MEPKKEVTLCPTCNGTKTVMGLGLIYRDCVACDKVGYVFVEPKQPVKIPDPEPLPIAAKPKQKVHKPFSMIKRKKPAPKVVQDGIQPLNA